MNIQQEKKESPLFKGHYKFTLANIETDEQRQLSQEIDDLVESLEEIPNASKVFETKLKIRELQDKLNSICRTEVMEYDNIIPTAGFTLITNNLTDPTPTNSILLNKAVLGTGTNPPLLGDTQLQTEVYRNDLASRTNQGAIAYVTAFFNATEVSGTFREAGIVADGDAAPNTGVLFSHVAINITKSLTQTLTLDWTLTLANAA